MARKRRDHQKEYQQRIAKAERLAREARQDIPSARAAAGHHPLREIDTAAGRVMRTGNDGLIYAAVKRAAARGEGVAFVVNRQHRGGPHKTHTIGNRPGDNDVVADLAAGGGGDRVDESAGEAREGFAPLDTRGGRGRPTVDVVPGQLDAQALLDLWDLYESWWALIADLDDDRDLYG